jgi:hypothetical protein
MSSSSLKHTELRQIRNSTTVRSSGMSGSTANTLPPPQVACGAEVATSIRSSPKKGMSNPPLAAANLRCKGGGGCWGVERNLVPQTTAAAAVLKRSCCEGWRRKPRRRIYLGVCSLPRTQHQTFPSQQQSKENNSRNNRPSWGQQKVQGARDQDQAAVRQSTTQKQGQSVQISSTKGSSLDDLFRVANIVQQITTELTGVMTEEGKAVAINEMVIKFMNPKSH